MFCLVEKVECFYYWNICLWKCECWFCVCGFSIICWLRKGLFESNFFYGGLKNLERIFNESCLGFLKIYWWNGYGFLSDLEKYEKICWKWMRILDILWFLWFWGM